MCVWYVRSNDPQPIPHEAPVLHLQERNPFPVVPSFSFDICSSVKRGMPRPLEVSRMFGLGYNVRNLQEGRKTHAVQLNRELSLAHVLTPKKKKFCTDRTS